MTIVGHGRILDAHLPPNSRARLRELAGTGSAQWGLLFVVDGTARRWTLYSPDAEYTAMLAPVAHTLELQHDLYVAKFPAWHADWAIH